MYAKYFLNTAISSDIVVVAKNIMNDVASILTGTTDLSTLISCKVESSVLVDNVRTAGWTLVEKVGDTKIVLKAPISDRPTSYKYIMFVYAPSNAYITVYAGTNWDATNKVLINSVANVNTSKIFVSTGMMTIIISSSVNHAIIYSQTSGGIYGPTGLSERSRESSWDTVENGFTNFALFDTNSSNTLIYNAYIIEPNSYRPITNSFANSNHNLSTVNGFSGGLYPPSGVVSKGPDLSNVYELVSLNYSFSGVYHLGGSISEKADVWVGPNNVGNHEDQMAVGVDVYVQLGAPAARLMVRYG